ncbi:Protein kinase domain-containing protein [Anaerocolumna jejuensis DSM 15929]|uniref:Protein kinase domain-containing protein n=1 Tax=Anaerocolumna jejuensis DSM 15929 TaxID=1121322 RepID=A0A1M6V8E7_9FIRM|nr:protein kinase [Anaerocolumna jejuensis]SHK77654.1 Protein kinase domain-containing protein [Anaerocolumna jejuensis DSM 15929]
MKDLEGMIITSTSGQTYLLTEKVDKQGAQGIVYEESTGKFIIKLYKRGNEYQNRNRMNKLEWLIKQSYPDQFIKPLDLFTEPYIGYAMEKVINHISLNKLLVPSRELTMSEWYNEETGGLRRRLFLGHKIAMQFALLHESNRAYCDISGNNIMVNKDSKVASICMIDIDNIYIPGGDSGNILGTSRYMAPEIVTKQMQPDIFTDDYSLAVILFELLRCGHPYVGDMVEDGTPEQQEQAYRGMYPYVDEEDSPNSSTQMLPVEVVFTNKLADLFYRTFVKGKENRVARTTAREFALACLEASNKVMKCNECGHWHYASPDKERKYFCPWCDEENERPIFLQFKDRYYVVDAKERNRIILKEEPVESFVLREEKNAITNNYISNLYIRRDKFSKPVDQYFVINKAKNGKFYLLNPKNSILYLQKNGQKERIPITKDNDQVEIGYKDRLFFSDIDINISKDPNAEIDEKYRGLVFRNAVFL